MRAAALIGALLITSSACAAENIPPAPVADITCKFRHPERDVNSLDDLPAPVVKLVRAIAGEMAGRGEFFFSTDVIDPNRHAPGKRFIRAGEIGDEWFVAFETGGIAYSKTALLFEPAKDGSPRLKASVGFYRDSLCSAVDDALDGKGTEIVLPAHIR